MPELNLISSAEACRLLGDIERSTLLSWVHQGKLLAAHKGPKKTSGYLFDRSYIEGYAEGLRQLEAARLVGADALPGLEVGR